jgi:hypothetical protein
MVDGGLCSFLVVDEAQDFSPQAHINLHAAAGGQVLYCIDSHQRLEDDTPIGPFLKQRFFIPDENCAELVATYRCPLKVIVAANEVTLLNRSLAGGKTDKDESTRVARMGGDEKAMGSLYCMDDKTLFDNLAIKQLAQTTHFAVVTTLARVEEIKKRLGTNLVFTPDTIKGLEYDVVLAVGLYDEALFKEMAMPSGESHLDVPANRAKAGKEDSRFTTYLNGIYVAYTRAKKALIISESRSRYTETLFSRLDYLFDKEEFSDLSFKATANQSDWLEQVKLQLKVGNDA